jgi:outer membrane protein OmpA-like peptidoglycan-associated protein
MSMVTMPRPVQVLLVAGGLGLSAALIVSCKPDKVEQKAPVPDKAEVQRAYQELSAQVSDLVSGYSALKSRLEMIPLEVPGVMEAKEKLASAESVLGTADARSRWLGGEVERALKSGDGALLAGVFAQIQATTSNIKHMKKLGIEVAHLIPPYDPDAIRKPWNHLLSGGVALRALEGGVEEQLVTFLSDKKAKPKADLWFAFDRIPLEAGRGEAFSAKSKAQLENLGQILKAHPQVTLTIGGFTDSSGLADANKQLSQKRAEAVRTALIGLGVAPGRLKAEGFGGENLVCPERDTEACRAKNRRLALVVTRK